jgi:GNAT superfamily N-acetyltransferase
MAQVAGEFWYSRVISRGKMLVTNEENVHVLIDAWKEMVKRLPGSSIEHREGVATMFGNVPMPFLNMSAADRNLPTGADLSRTLTIARARASECPHHSLLALCSEWTPQNWEAAAAQAGFQPMMHLTGMASNALLPPRRAAPYLEFRLVSDDATARDIATVNGHAYGLPAEMFECICNMYLWQKDSFGVVGYAGGKAVTAAAAFPVADTIYVAFVATHPDAQKKGYAEAAMRRAIDEGRSAWGLTRMTLHASDAGRPIYEAMGFESGSKISLLAMGA